jgi:RNA polymerase sigma factor (sigma-70 family)
VFVSNLSTIDSVVRFVCQRHNLSGSDADDFSSEVRLRLLENDYEVFRRFQQRSSLRTYLTVIIQRIYADYRNHRWGKWRPSAEARRLGPIAIRLESLLMRDGLGFDQACEVLRTNERLAVTESELARIAARLPPRYRRAIVGEEVLATLAADGDACEDSVLHEERQRTARRVIDALVSAFRKLGDHDLLILRLKFQEGLGIADIARALHLRQKPLYRRVGALLQELREALEVAGIDRCAASEIVNREGMEISVALLRGIPPPSASGSTNGPLRA